MIYEDARKINNRYTECLAMVAEKAGCQWALAPRKAAYRSFEKIALNPDSEWNGSVLTDVVRLAQPAACTTRMHTCVCVYVWLFWDHGFFLLYIFMLTPVFANSILMVLLPHSKRYHNCSVTSWQRNLG